MSEVLSLCDQIREVAYAIHVYHGNGYLEKVYENALVHRLRKEGFDVEQQYPIVIRDEDGTEIGEYFSDIIVDKSVIVELKALKTLSGEHEAQLFNCLKATRIKDGLLINFGSYKFQIKKLIYS
ncbi:MAG: GxxExxY protein [Kiritimatiellia bacterium]